MQKNTHHKRMVPPQKWYWTEKSGSTLFSSNKKKKQNYKNIPKCVPYCWISVDNHQYCLNHTLNTVLSNPDTPDHGCWKRREQEITAYSSFHNCFHFSFMSPLMHHTVTSLVSFSTASNLSCWFWSTVVLRTTLPSLLVTPSAVESSGFFVSFLESLCMRNDSRCLSNSCQKNSTCVAGHKDDPCLCADASVDSVEELCNKTSDPCSSNPCLQNATCLGSAGNLSFTCECPAGYDGPTCERADSDCDTNPCEHGGTCQSGLAGPTCLCSAGYTGTLCEMDLDECVSEPCRNGALCRDGVDEYSCYCVPGYQGKHCDLEVNECASDPCLNGATCLNQIGHYDCLCPLGYTGKCC